jgi:parvulin-like peptidyl-prolyl isomerase
VGQQRLALLAFGAMLVLLFIGFAIAQGIGHDRPGPGEVAVVEGVPADIATITEDEMRRAVARAKLRVEENPEATPGESQADSLRKTTLTNLLRNIWIQGEAEDLGISVAEKEIADDLEKFKRENFPVAGLFEEFLEEEEATQADLENEFEVQSLQKKVTQAAVKKAQTKATKQEIADYYEAAIEDGQYLLPETRLIRRIVNKDKAKVEQALSMLADSSSGRDWERVAAELSTDSKETRGRQSLLRQAGTPTRVFTATPGQVEGPIKVKGQFAIFEVERVIAEPQPLQAVERQIATTIDERLLLQLATEFEGNFQDKWQPRTFCADGYVIERCADFKPAYSPTCSEGLPEVGIPASCAAPVAQREPALRGSISALEPEGTRLPQRPVPASLDPVLLE